jgi:hypothetical protein
VTHSIVPDSLCVLEQRIPKIRAAKDCISIPTQILALGQKMLIVLVKAMEPPPLPLEHQMMKSIQG